MAVRHDNGGVGTTSPTHCPCALHRSLNVKGLKSSHGALTVTVCTHLFMLSLQLSAVH